jgi:energy-coupling factor transport system ATP-binding protein
VAVIFQNPDAQIVEQTVLADVCFGMENLAVPRLEMAYRAERALTACGLSKLTHAQVGELSGGQKQLLCIAGALAMSPQVLILDEATSMLPPATRQQILQVVQQQHQSGMTLVWITQWMEEAAQAQRVIALNQGRVAFDGTPEEFFHPTLVVNSAQPGHGGGESSETKKTSSVCENLGFPLPYTLEVTKALANRGIRWQNWPLTPAALTRELSQL